MTKQEILQELTANGNVNRFSRTPSWEKAFDAYNLANPKDKRRLGCGSCYRDVLAWLKK
jgi:hypothetical protein